MAPEASSRVRARGEGRRGEGEERKEMEEEGGEERKEMEEGRG